MDRECQDTDEEKGNDEGQSYHDKLDVDDDDDEQVERYKDDDIISKHSQSTGVVKVKIATGAEQVVLIR